MKTVALIGLGAIGRLVLRELAGDSDIAVVGVLVRPKRLAEARALLPPAVPAVTTIAELLRLKPDLVAECAGQGAVVEFADTVLAHGTDLLVIATGAFADQALYRRLIATAKTAGARLLLPAGAIAGLDGLTALRIGGLNRVTYTSVKPPHAWAGTPAEQAFPLDRLTERTVVFRGSPLEAARSYPKNANLAMTVALAGIGVDRTEIELVADPAAADNIGRIEAEGRHGRLTLEFAGMAAPDNPKTSSVTALSIVHAIRNLTATVIMP